jgi:SAM-dependent methyltransferase
VSDVDIRRHNSQAWDREAERGNLWTRPVESRTVRAASRGDWSILLTPTKPVPREWFPPLRGARVLCLASGGGQQGPVLAAAGARVTVLDGSPRQLAGDLLVARRDALDLGVVLGDMIHLAMFPDSAFDLIVHPVSNCFVQDVRAVWREAYRVLRPGGSLMSGFSNGLIYIFDSEAMDRGVLTVTHSLPYSDLAHLETPAVQKLLAERRPLEFGHTLTDQIGGQIDAGFTLRGFYEDFSPQEPLSRHTPTFGATRAAKPGPPPAMHPGKAPGRDARSRGAPPREAP